MFSFKYPSILINLDFGAFRYFELGLKLIIQLVSFIFLVD